MAALDFPSSPTLNQTYTANGLTYKWNGESWVTNNPTDVGNSTGTLAVANGGSGQTTAQTAMNAFAGAVTSGSYLRGNGTDVVMSTIQAADVPTLNQNTTGQAGKVANALTAGTNITFSSGTTYDGSTAITINATGGGGSGTVTSVGLSMPTQFTVTNSPVTTSGTLTAAWATQTANTVFAGPSTGGAVAPTFRSLVAADVPTLNQNTTGTASNVTGTVAIANGGSGQTTAQTAMNAFAGAVTSGSYLRGNGTNVVMSTIQAADVPTLNQNTTGSAATLTTARTIQTNLASTSSASFNGSANVTPGVTGTLPVANGGTGATTLTANNVLLGNGTSALQAVAPGTSGNILTSNGTTWVSATAPASGATISNDTATASDLYPLFASATSGLPTTIYTSNAKLLYKPSTGELQASELNANNGIVVNSQTVSADYTIAAGNNAMSAGPVSVASGITVTVSSGSRWVVV
jgi:hypothetical protein